MNKRRIPKSAFAVLAMCCYLASITWIHPALQLIHEAYPTADPVMISQIATMPSLLAMIATTINGALVEKKISYKASMLAGLILIAISGICPVLLPLSIRPLLVSRMMFGVGVGMIGIRNTVIIRHFREPLQSNLLGWALLASNGASFIAQTLCGVLSEIHWSYAFIPYAGALLPIIMLTLWFKNVEIEPTSHEKEKSAHTDITKTPVFNQRTIACIIVFFFLIMMMTPFSTQMSTFISKKGLGNSAIAGSILSVKTLSGMIAGYFYGRISRRCGNNIITIVFISLAIGGALGFFARNLAALYAAAIFVGIGTTISIVVAPKYVSEFAPKEHLAFMVSLTTAFGNLGMYASTYWLFISRILVPFGITDFEKTMLAMAIITAVMALLAIFKKDIFYEQKDG